MADLLTIGTSGVLAQQTLLQTSSNNISNVNTEGYTRQSTQIYTNIVNQGCGLTTTTRVLDNYAEKELLRDNASVGYYSSVSSGMSTVDSLLTNSSTGLSSTLTDLFSTIQSANTNPTSTANRNELLGTVQTFADRVNTLSSNIQTEYLNTNKQIEETVQTVNQLLDGIYKMNNEIVKGSSSSSDSSAYLQMMDERDRLITELSSYMDVKTVSQDNGSVLVNMSSGQTLVLGDGCAKLAVSASSLDDTEYELKFTYGGAYTSLKSDVGGKLGGYFDSCTNLKNTQRELGTMVVALADALNKQNSSGLTLTNNVGTNIFSLPTQSVSSSSTTASMTMNYVPGECSNITGNDYLVTIGDSSSYTIFEKVDGEYVERSSGTITGDTLSLPDYGFELSINGNVSKGDKFLVQPTLDIGFSFGVEISKPEDFGFASVVRANQNSQNQGNATIAITGVTNTSNSSAFNIDANKNITLNADAPANIVIDADGNFQVYDSNKNLIGTADASTNGQNILANLHNATGDKIYDDFATNPGYDFSISGTVKSGDNFSIEINLNGFADNSNGILMQDIEQAKIVNGTVNKTAAESYSSLVSTVGTNVKIANINLEAATAKQEQSKTLTESAKGVNLDEEAANLVRFQQSYAASAKIISAAQTIFDSLMGALG
jgi:flagellar hook-associated protein 1